MQYGWSYFLGRDVQYSVFSTLAQIRVQYHAPDFILKHIVGFSSSKFDVLLKFNVSYMCIWAIDRNLVRSVLGFICTKN